MIEPDFQTFSNLAQRGNLVPVYDTFTADLLTPVGAYLRLAQQRALRLSARKRRRRRENRALHVRGRQSRRSLPLRQRRLRVWKARAASPGRSRIRSISCAIASSATSRCACRDLPPLVAGAIGYFAYDMVRLFERIPDSTRNDLAHGRRRDDVLSRPGRFRPRAPPRLDRAQRLHRRHRAACARSTTPPCAKFARRAASSPRLSTTAARAARAPRARCASLPI